MSLPDPIISTTIRTNYSYYEDCQEFRLNFKLDIDKLQSLKYLQQALISEINSQDFMMVMYRLVAREAFKGKPLIINKYEDPNIEVSVQKRLPRS